MAKNSPMTEDELRALTDSEMRQSVGYWGGKLAEQRRKAEYYYLGLPKGDLTPPEVEGRSAVVSPDVRNTIEAMMPQLMVKFCGGDSVVEFEPTKPGPEFEQEARNITEYLNYLFFKKNSGHLVTYTMFKDAMLQKRGMVKVWWDDRVEETKEEYKGLSDIELSELTDDEEVEIVSHDAVPDEEDAEARQKALDNLNQQLQQAMQPQPAPQQQPQQAPPAGQPGQAQQPGQPPQAPQPSPAQQLQAQIDHINSMPPVMLHNVECKRSKKGGKITVENVPPEEFLISRKAKSINDSSFIGHRVARTMSDLRSMGYKNIDNISSDDGAAMLNAERIERLGWDDEQAYMNIENISQDESQRQVWVTECYIRCDYDGDGISELRKVVRAGNQILDNDVVDVVPFASVCPVPLPHKFFGLSIADLAFDSQLTKTALLRAKIDNTFLQVNGRYFAVDGQVNLDDLLTSRPGGVVRIKQGGAVGRLDQGQMDGSADGMLEYMDAFLESSTGWTRNSQGNAPGDLQGTATGMNIITNKDDMRLDLIARNFAEGFCDIFKLMLKLVCQHQNEEAETKLNGQWIKIDPREWRNQYDVNINVGLGVGNKDQRVSHLMAMRQQQDIGMNFGVATPQNVYNANCELAKELGFKSADKFFTDPVKNPPPQKPDPEQMKAQAQIPLIQAKAQADSQMKQMELQVLTQHKQSDGQLQMQIEQVKNQAALQIEQAKLQMQAQIEQKKLEMQAQTERQKMEMQAMVDRNRQEVEAQQQAAKVDKEAQLEQFKNELEKEHKNAELNHAMQLEQLKQAAAREIAELESATRIQVAQIGAQQAVSIASLSAQQAAATEVSTELSGSDK